MFLTKLILTTFAVYVQAIDITVNPLIDAEIKLSATQLDKVSLFRNSTWFFDFTKQPLYTYSPGSVVNANAATFPASTGYGMTVAILNLGPCAMLPPHYHPRANNFVVAIQGVTDTWMIEENGAEIVNQTLEPFQMTIFPAGSIHSMQNTGCDRATLVSAMNSEDAGTQNILNFAQLPPDIIAAAFGNPSGGFHLPSIPGIGTGSIPGSAACKAACGIKP